MSITRIFLLINAIGWALFGFYAFFNPETLRTTILGANTISSDGVSELMAIYGGTCLGAATLFLSAFFKPHLERPALYFIIAYMGGIAVARFFASFLAGFPSSKFLAFWAIESVSALIAIFLLVGMARFARSQVTRDTEEE